MSRRRSIYLHPLPLARQLELSCIPAACPPPAPCPVSCRTTSTSSLFFSRFPWKYEKAAQLHRHNAALKINSGTRRPRERCPVLYSKGRTSRGWSMRVSAAFMPPVLFTLGVNGRGAAQHDARASKRSSVARVNGRAHAHGLPRFSDRLHLFVIEASGTETPRPTHAAAARREASGETSGAEQTSRGTGCRDRTAIGGVPRWRRTSGRLAAARHDRWRARGGGRERERRR